MLSISVSLRQGVAVGLLTLVLGSAGAQTADDALTVVQLPNVQLPGAQWKRVGSVAMQPNQTSVRTTAGTNVLVGTAEQGRPVELDLAAPDGIRVRTDFMLSPDAEALLGVGNCFVRLTGAETGAQPTGTLQAGDNTNVLHISQPVGKATGLWQTLDLTVSQEKGRTLAERVSVNGVLLHENAVLPGGAAPGRISLQVLRGTAAFRNVAYQILSNQKLVRLSNVRYRLYDGESSRRSDLGTKPVLREGSTDAITNEIGFGMRRYSYVYTADLDMSQADRYTFTLHHGGIAGLEVDGKELIPAGYKELGQPQSASVDLPAGKHQLTVFFSRLWPRPGLGVFVAGRSTRPQALHTQASLPEPDPIGAITLRAEDKPALVRSFIQLPGEKNKRTHCLSVGSPAGLHYTVDLNRGALLQAWKGDFADVTEMWHERGEPQLLKPVGVAIPLNGQGPLALLANSQQFWPDSLSEQEFSYKGWKIDKQGYPTTQYRYRDLDISDRIAPEADGRSLDRTLTVSGPATEVLYARLAAGSSIEEIGKGLYAVDDRRYYVRLDGKVKPMLRTVGASKELVVPVNPKGNSVTVRYVLSW